MFDSMKGHAASVSQTASFVTLSNLDVKKYEQEIHDASFQAYIDVFVRSALWSAFREVYVEPMLSKSMASAGTRVLDVGCGPRPLHCRGLLDYVGLDISPASLREAKRMFPDREFVAADAELLPFRDASFHRILCFGSLHHLPSPHCFLEEARRCLKIAGLYIGYEPNVRQRRLDLFAGLASNPIGRLLSRVLYPVSKEIPMDGPIHSMYEREYSLGDLRGLFKTWSIVSMRSVWILDLHSPTVFREGLAALFQKVVFRLDSVLSRFLGSRGIGHVHLLYCRRPD